MRLWHHWLRTHRDLSSSASFRASMLGLLRAVKR